MTTLPISAPIPIQHSSISPRENDLVESYEKTSFQEVSSKSQIFSISIGTAENGPNLRTKKSFSLGSNESVCETNQEKKSFKMRSFTQWDGSPMILKNIPELSRIIDPLVRWNEEDPSIDKLSILQKFFPHEYDRSKLSILFSFIANEKKVWLETMRQSPLTLIKRKTPLVKTNTNHCFSLYIAKSPTGILDIYFNLGKRHLIGKGSFKQVFKILNLSTLKLAALSKTNFPCSLEAKIMKMFPNHPYLLQAQCIEKIGNKQYMLMPYCELGNLSKAHVFLTKANHMQITKDVLNGLHTLHRSYIAHRDIKPENILLYPDMEGNIRAKLADFGLSESFAENHLVEHRSGTLEFIPLEMLEEKFHSLQLEKGDSFAIGSTLYMTLKKLENPQSECSPPFRDLYPFFLLHTPLPKDIQTSALQSYKKKFSRPNSLIQQIFFGLFHPDRTKRFTIWQALNLLNTIK